MNEKNKVWKAILMNEALEDTMLLISIWDFKKKSNGNYRGRLNTCRFKQIEGIH